MAKRAAGLMMFRRCGSAPAGAAPGTAAPGGRRAAAARGKLQVLLVHPGGPLWQSRDAGVWTIPKGELAPGEEALSAARREFNEETGLTAAGEFIPLGSITQKSGKIVEAWAFEGDCAPESIVSNTFAMEWPPKSGTRREFPEVDRAAFFTIDEAKAKINPFQAPLLDRLRELIG